MNIQCKHTHQHTLLLPLDILKVFLLGEIIKHHLRPKYAYSESH